MSRPAWVAKFSDESIERFRGMPSGQEMRFYDVNNMACISVARCGRPERLYLFFSAKDAFGTRNYVEYDYPEFDPLAAYPVKYDVEFVTEARPAGPRADK